MDRIPIIDKTTGYTGVDWLVLNVEEFGCLRADGRVAPEVKDMFKRIYMPGATEGSEVFSANIPRLQAAVVEKALRPTPNRRRLIYR